MDFYNRKPIIIFALAMAIISSVPTRAAPMDRGLQVIVTGTVPTICEIGNSNNVDISELLINSISNIYLPLNCNAPYSISIVSTRGALKGEYSNSLVYFSRNIEYSIEASINFDNGTEASCKCSSSEMLSVGDCGIVSTQGRTSIAQFATINFLLGNANQPYLAGKYTDQVRVKLTTEF